MEICTDIGVYQLVVVDMILHTQRCRLGDSVGDSIIFAVKIVRYPMNCHIDLDSSLLQPLCRSFEATQKDQMYPVMK